jgi:hypothetical protein
MKNNCLNTQKIYGLSRNKIDIFRVEKHEK